MQILIKSLVFIVLLSGCKTYKAKYPYSLSDFNPELRVHLEKIVENGGMCEGEYNADREYIVPETYTYLSEKTSVKDLYKLINSEHPVLRAYAFNILCDKEDSSINQILLNHLDDTAIVTVCRGEWGEKYAFVSDYFISQSERNTKILKSDLTDKVIKNHSYLSYAYFFIEDLENLEEKYYPVIKQMTKNPRGVHWYDKLEVGLYVLSKYKKSEDVSFIANQLSTHWRSFSGYGNHCFSIITNNPDTAYFKILEAFYRNISRPSTKEELQYNFYNSWYKLAEKYDSFLRALVSYKNKRSSEMIDTIIKRDLIPYNFSRGETYHYTVYKLLKENECPEYKRLIKLLEPKAIAIEKERALYQMPPMEVSLDTSFSSKHDPRYW